jgi:hypothetical protein
MGITEVRSPASSSSRSKVGSDPGIGPGARSNPSRGQRSDQSSNEPTKARVSLGSGGEPAEIHVTGPKELPHGGAKPQERQSPEE